MAILFEEYVFGGNNEKPAGEAKAIQKLQADVAALQNGLSIIENACNHNIEMVQDKFNHLAEALNDIEGAFDVADEMGKVMDAEFSKIEKAFKVIADRLDVLANIKANTRLEVLEHVLEQKVKDLEEANSKLTSRIIALEDSHNRIFQRVLTLENAKPAERHYI